LSSITSYASLFGSSSSTQSCFLFYLFNFILQMSTLSSLTGNVTDSISSSLMNSTFGSSLTSFLYSIQHSDGQAFSLPFANGPEVEKLIAASLIVLGFALVFLGCRLFKTALFALVFVAVAGLTYFLGVNQGESATVMFAIAMVLGLFCALLSIKLWKLALFAVGFCTGLVVFIVVKSLYGAAVATPGTELAVLLVPGLVLGVVSVLLERYWLLFATPILGSFLFTQGIDHFANLDINVFGTLQGTATCSSDECFGLWAATFGLAILGMIIQYRYTAGFSSWDNSKPTSIDTRIAQVKYVKQIDV